MGQTLSEQIDEREKKEEHHEALKLRKIERDMRQRFEEKKATLYIGALNDECLPIVCAVDKFYDFLYVKDVTDASGIQTIMNKHLRGKYKAKFVDLIKSVVKNVLKKKSAESYMHVVYANMSFLRIDYYIYFTDDVLFYFVQVGVLDMGRVRLPVLIYELTRATRPTHLKELVVKAKETAQYSRILHPTLNYLADAAKQTTVTKLEEWEEEGGGEDEGDDEEEQEEGGGGRRGGRRGGEDEGDGEKEKGGGGGGEKDEMEE